MSDQEQQKPPIKEGLTEDFAAVYANQFHFEISAWDLAILLGQANNFSGKTEIEWHTRVTMPPGAAKVLHYLLGLNIAIYESSQGKVNMKAASIPPLMTPPTGDQDTEQNRKFYELAVKLHNHMTGEDQAP